MVRVRKVCSGCVRTVSLLPSVSRSQEERLEPVRRLEAQDQLSRLVSAVQVVVWGLVMIVTSYTRLVVESHREECAGFVGQAGRWLRGERAASGRVEGYRIESPDLAPMLAASPRRGVLTDVPVTKTAEVRGVA